MIAHVCVRPKRRSSSKTHYNPVHDPAESLREERADVGKALACLQVVCETAHDRLGPLRGVEGVDSDELLLHVEVKYGHGDAGREPDAQLLSEEHQRGGGGEVGRVGCCLAQHERGEGHEPLADGAEEDGGQSECLAWRDIGVAVDD